MKYRMIPGTDVNVSEISLGCWTMGGPNWREGQPIGWAAVDPEDITRAIRLALDAGVNHFDNADVYGNGLAERMLAASLASLGVRSESVLIATKIGHFAGTAAHAYEPAHIRHQCEQSLINLRRDYIDIYYFHHGNFGPNGEYLAEAAGVMDRLVEEGKVRVKGQSAYSLADFERAVPVVRPRVLQSWAHALDDKFVAVGSGLQALMDRHDLAFVAFSPLAQGLLLDKFDPQHPPSFEPGDHRGAKKQFQSEHLALLRPKLGRLKERFGARVEDLAAMALQYVLAHPRVLCVIPGFRNERQVACNLAGADGGMSAEDLAFVRSVLAG